MLRSTLRSWRNPLHKSNILRVNETETRGDKGKEIGRAERTYFQSILVQMSSLAMTINILAYYAAEEVFLKTLLNISVKYKLKTRSLSRLVVNVYYLFIKFKSNLFPRITTPNTFPRHRYRDKANTWLGDQRKLLTSGAVTTDMFISALNLKYKVLCKVCRPCVCRSVTV